MKSKEFSLLVHLSTLFVSKLCREQNRKKTLHRKAPFVHMPTLSNKNIHETQTIFFLNFHYLSTGPHFFFRILKDRKKRWSRKTASFTQFTLLNDEITEVIFFRILITLRSLSNELRIVIVLKWPSSFNRDLRVLVHLSTLFVSKLWREHNRKKTWNRKAPFVHISHTYK